jgi:hypothetical protein
MAPLPVLDEALSKPQDTICRIRDTWISRGHPLTADRTICRLNERCGVVFKPKFAYIRHNAPLGSNSSKRNHFASASDATATKDGFVARRLKWNRGDHAAGCTRDSSLASWRKSTDTLLRLTSLATFRVIRESFIAKELLLSG